MLEVLHSTNTIEDAIYIISRKLELMHKVFSQIWQSNIEDEEFAIRFMRNIDPKGLGNEYL